MAQPYRYNAYPTWLGQGATPQFYKPPASPQFGTQGLGVSSLAQVGTVFGGGHHLASGFGGAQFGGAQFGGAQFGSSQFGGSHFGGATSAYPTWLGSGPVPDFYKPPAHFDITQMSHPQVTGGHFTQQAAPVMSSAAPQINGAFPTWFGTGPAPDFYKPAANFDLGVGQGLNAGISGAEYSGAFSNAFPTWLGSGPVPEFYKPPATFDIGNTNFLSNAPRGFQQAVGGNGFGWSCGHAGFGGFLGLYPQPAFGADHTRLMNEIRTFEYSGHGFHSGLRGAGSIFDTAAGPRDLPVDPAHQQLMQEVRAFEPHDKPGEHPGLKGSGTAIDTAAGPKDLPDDPQHKQLMEEVRKHSK